MAEPKNHLMHYRDGKRMALCGRMAYGSWFDEPERWGRLPSSEQCGHCRAALRRMGGVDGYMREALEARRAADEAEIVGHPQELIISRHSSTDPVDDDAVAGRRHGWGLCGDGVCAAAG